MISVYQRVPRKATAIWRRKAIFNRRGTAIELFIGRGMSIINIAKILSTDPGTISKDLDYYFKKPETELTLKSKV